MNRNDILEEAARELEANGLASSAAIVRAMRTTPKAGANRTDRLRRLMRLHGLTAADLGVILAKSPNTVAAWRVGNHCAIPASTLELLESMYA
jgi:hypothetical protein